MQARSLELVLVAAVATACHREAPAACIGLSDLLAGCGHQERLGSALTAGGPAQAAAIDFFGPKPGLPPVLTGLLGASDGELAAISPYLLSRSARIYADVTVELRINERTRRVSEVNVKLPHEALGALLGAWGGREPEADHGHIRVRAMRWVNPEARLSVVLGIGDAPDEFTELGVTRYTPALDVLGPGPEIAALPRPILGQRPDAVLDAYPELAPDRSMLSLLTEHGSTRISLKTESGLVTAYSMPIPYGDDETAREALRAQFTAKWGVPQSTTTDTSIFHVGDLRITVRDNGESAWVLTVERWR